MTTDTSFALAVKDSSDPAIDRTRKDRGPVGVDPVIAEARRRWTKCFEAEKTQRESILAAKKFRAGDQWPEAMRLQREGASSIQGTAAQPARPCLTIDRLSQPVRQLSNQIKQAAFSIDVLPNGFGADDATAEIIQGYLRRVQNEARAESPIEWATDGAIEGGLGWFRILTDYVYETWDGDPNDPAVEDQELRFGRITNSLTVYCDPSAVKPTKSDALFMFVTEDMDRDEFKSVWPNADMQSLEDFAATGDMPDWADQDTVRIAEYWRIRFEDQPVGKRVIRKPVVEGFKITATEVLEKWDWLGSHIPLIPILGEELNIDGRPVLRGVIQEGMDAQRMVNYTYSGAIEIFALGNKAPWIAATGAVDAYKSIWQNANTYNYSWLPWDTYDEMGRQMPEPHRENSEPPIQAAVALMLKSEEAIKASTGVYDPSLEYNNPKEHSGRAIQSLQSQSEMGASNYPMHVQRALIYAGELMVEIIPKLTRPGQVLQILGADEEPEQVMVGAPFQKHPETGQPVPVSPEQHAQQPDLTDFYDFKKGKYAVTVTVGKGSATKREEGAAALADLIPHLTPEMAAVATPDYVEQLSFPGAHKIAEKLKKALPPHLQDQEEGGPDPEKQAMQQQIQQLQQALQGKQAEEQAKQQATMAKAQMDAQTDLQKTQMEIASREKIALIQASTTMNVAQGKIDAEDARTFVDAMENRMAGLLELHMAKLGQVHAAIQQQHDTAHDVAMAAMDQAHQKDMAAQAQDAASQQMAQQAALQPPSGEGA